MCLHNFTFLWNWNYSFLSNKSGTYCQTSGLAPEIYQIVYTYLTKWMRLWTMWTCVDLLACLLAIVILHRCTMQECSSQVKGSNLCPLLNTWCIRFWGSTTLKGMGIVEQCQWRAAKPARQLDHMAYKGRLRELGLFNLEKTQSFPMVPRFWVLKTLEIASVQQ